MAALAGALRQRTNLEPESWVDRIQEGRLACARGTAEERRPVHQEPLENTETPARTSRNSEDPVAQLLIDMEPSFHLLDSLIDLVDGDHRLDLGQTTGNEESIKQARLGFRLQGGEDEQRLVNVGCQNLGTVLRGRLAKKRVASRVHSNDHPVLSLHFQGHPVTHHQTCRRRGAALPVEPPPRRHHDGVVTHLHSNQRAVHRNDGTVDNLHDGAEYNQEIIETPAKLEETRAGINPAPTVSFVGEGFIPSHSTRIHSCAGLQCGSTIC